MSKYVEKRDSVTEVPVLGSLSLCNFNGVRLHASPLGLINTFILEQYRCRRAGIGVVPGDVVLDGGGCWADTALHFATTAKQVFCFECMPSNVRIIEHNLRLNPALGAKISVIQKALWSCSGKQLVFNDVGPGSRLASETNGVAVETQAIDDFVSSASLERVDFKIGRAHV